MLPYFILFDGDETRPQIDGMRKLWFIWVGVD
jgi:hypothetical protein